MRDHRVVATVEVQQAPLDRWLARPYSRGRSRRTQAERRAAAIERMLDAAITLISETGYRGTTLAEIGHRAGYSRGLAHHYFGSKLGLMRAVAKELDRRFARKMQHPPPAR